MLGVFVIGCSDPPPPVSEADAGTDAGGSDAGDVDAGSPTSSTCRLGTCPIPMDVRPEPVSFATQIVPILQRQCGDSPCHGGRAAVPYLGPSLPAAPNPADMWTRIVGVPSATAPAIDLVEPGAPAQSFLVLKVEGCQNASGLACTPLLGAMTGMPCGDTMPQGGRPVCNSDRELLRRWIQQGALEN